MEAISRILRNFLVAEITYDEADGVRQRAHGTSPSSQPAVSGTQRRQKKVGS